MKKRLMPINLRKAPDNSDVYKSFGITKLSALDSKCRIRHLLSTSIIDTLIGVIPLSRKSGVSIKMRLPVVSVDICIRNGVE